jgi:hypothetical protein
MSRLTVFLARLIGLSFILIVISFLLRGSVTIDATAADAPVMLVYAITGLAVGVAMILGHNVWSGGALPVIVTLVGWLILAKSLLLLFLTPEALSRFYQQIHYGEHSYFFVAPAFLIGLYLTWAGFTTPMSRGS